MKFEYLLIGDNKITEQSIIIKTLKTQKFNWVVDAEFENAQLEIKNNTIVWHDGDWYNSDWVYGIWTKGSFNGKWLNGIWEGGIFKGKWVSGINNTETEIN
jgi:hypothetical protein